MLNIHFERIKKLRHILEDLELDAIFLKSYSSGCGSTIPNIYYFTGYHEIGSVYYLITQNREVLFCSETQLAKKVSLCTEIYHKKETEYLDILKSVGAKKIGVDGAMEYGFCAGLKNEIDTLELTDVSENLLNLRSIKSSDEIDNVRTSCNLCDNILHNVFEGIGINSNELDVGKSLNLSCVNKNLNQSFPPLVAGDFNAAEIHHMPQNHKVQKMVLVDFGVFNNFYASDATRTKIFAKDKEILSAFNALYELQGELEDFIVPGILVRDAHNFAHSFLLKRGFENTSFGNFHSLGHGVGLEIHEYPNIGPKSEHIFENNMTFTIEPGIYVQGKFGIRIEDTVLLKKGKVERLTNFNDFL